MVGIVKNVRSLAVLLRSSRELHLNSVDAINAVDEEDKYEDKCNFQPILYFGHNWVLGDEATQSIGGQLGVPAHKKRGSTTSAAGNIRKDLALHAKRQRHDEEHEQSHLQHQQDKYLLFVKTRELSLRL